MKLFPLWRDRARMGERRDGEERGEKGEHKWWKGDRLADG